MSESAGTKAFAAFIGITGILAMVFGAIFVWQGISERWPHTLAFGVVGIGGLPVALAGLVIATQCPLRSGRAIGTTLTVAGTLAIGTLAGAMYWTILGPAIALVIVSFWVYQVLQWAQGARIAVRQ